MSDPKFPTIQEYLATSNTGNIFHDMGVAQLNMSMAVSRATNEQKLQIQDLSGQMEEINALSDLLRKKRAVSNDQIAVGPRLGDDYTKIVTLLKAFCGDNVDLSEAVNSDSQIKQITIDAWVQALSGANQDKTSKASELNTRSQSFVSAYDAFLQSASGLTRKNEQTGGAIANNVRK